MATTTEKPPVTKAMLTVTVLAFLGVLLMALVGLFRVPK